MKRHNYTQLLVATDRVEIVDVGCNKRVWIASQFDVGIVSDDFCVTAVWLKRGEMLETTRLR